MSTIKILVVEDEVLIAEHIKDYLHSFGMENIFLAHNKKIALQAIDHIKPDLILLDLHLEKPLDGIEIAKMIDDHWPVPYIFITANADRLIIQEAVHTKAVAYITKPLKKTDLFAAVQIAIKSNLSVDTKCLLVKDSGSTLRVPVNEISYIESSGNYIHIHTKKQKIISRQSLEWAEEQLPKHQFLRVHRSFVVNTNFVTKITTKSLFISETEIPISRANTATITKFFKDL